MWAQLPALGWQYLHDDSQLVVGEYLFRPGWFVLAALALALFLWKAGGAALTLELDRALAALIARRRAVLAAMVLLSAGASISLDLWALGGHPHTQDEIAYLFQARTLAQGKLWQPAPPEGLLPAFQTVFLVADGDRWYGKYPVGWPLVLALPARLGLEWLVNPLLNALALLLLHRSLSRHLSPGYALGGTALLAASPFFVLMGASLLTHPLTLLLALVIVEGAAMLPSARGAWLVALATGAIHLVRPLDALALGLPAFLLALYHLRGRRELAIVLLVPLVFIGLTLAYNACMTGDPRLSPFLKHSPSDRPGFGPDVGTFQREGHNFYKGLMNLAFNMLALNEDVYGWPSLALFVVAAGVILPAAWTWLERIWLAMALAIGLQYFTFMGHGIAFGPRYYHVWLPALVLFTLRAGDELVRRTGPHEPPAESRLALIASLFAVLAVVTYWPARVDSLHDYWNVLSRPRAVLAHVPAEADLVVVPPLRWHERDLYDSFFGLNGADLAAAHPLFVRDGPWVNDGRLTRAFPGRKLARIPEADARSAVQP